MLMSFKIDHNLRFHAPARTLSAYPLSKFHHHIYTHSMRRRWDRDLGRLMNVANPNYAPPHASNPEGCGSKRVREVLSQVIEGWTARGLTESCKHFSFL